MIAPGHHNMKPRAKVPVCLRASANRANNPLQLTGSNKFNPRASIIIIYVSPAESLPIVEAASYLPMVERVGAYFKELTLVYVGSKYLMSRDCIELIECITRCCRYEILTLDAFSKVGLCAMCPTDVNIMAQLVTIVGDPDTQNVR